ncbi:pyridoxal-phosphate-dependent aminotransferase family protein [Primorskyibacter sp. S187A]|uniref:pyridoxal-phosphate-dependent aminotransferase family protein n=1 Tax=Primorskyibacter sp. S187A TaxID=3415130 RepID=UPI003C7A59AC
MSLAQGRPYLAIPGPSVMPEAVLRAMMRAGSNIYEGELIDLTASLVPDLKYVAQTEGHVAMYIANGHGAWEAALANVVGPDDLVLVPATGRFGHGWAEMARGLGISFEVMDHGLRAPWDLDAIEDRLRADTEHRIKAVLAVHVDTSTSIKNDVPGLRSAMDAAGHPALLMADCIASLGCDRFEMDAWGVDVTVAGSQKGLMVPPGMGFVWFNDNAKAHRPARVSSYWDWSARAQPELYYQYFGGTAPTHHLWALRAALDLMRAEGMDAIWARHALLARGIWTAVTHWGQGGSLEMNVADEGFRSHAVTALRIDAPLGRDLRQWCEDQAGVTLGIGLGMTAPDDPARHGFFRFGHMGHVNAQMVMGMLGSVEAGLHAIGAPFSPGGASAATAVLASGAHAGS